MNELIKGIFHIMHFVSTQRPPPTPPIESQCRFIYGWPPLLYYESSE